MENPMEEEFKISQKSDIIKENSPTVWNKEKVKWNGRTVDNIKVTFLKDICTDKVS